MLVQKVSLLASEPSIIIMIQARDYKGLSDEQKNNYCILHILKPFKCVYVCVCMCVCVYTYTHICT